MKVRYSGSHRFRLGTGRIQLKVYDGEGRLVRNMIDAVQEPSADAYVAVWDG